MASPRQLDPPRFTVSRERAHSTGVESTSRGSSCHPGLRAAKEAISASIVSASRPRRRWNPERPARAGNRRPRRFAAIFAKRSSEQIPMIDCPTQRVTTSASVSLLLAFFLPSGRRSSAVQKTAVSSRSRSASVEAPYGSAVITEHRRLRPRCSLPLPPPSGRGIRGTTHPGRSRWGLAAAELREPLPNMERCVRREKDDRPNFALRRGQDRPTLHRVKRSRVRRFTRKGSVIEAFVTAEVDLRCEQQSAPPGPGTPGQTAPYFRLPARKRTVSTGDSFPVASTKRKRKTWGPRARAR